MTNAKRPLRVWYGWEKLNKVKRHEALCIIYEDSIQSEDRTMGFVNKSMKVSWVRDQSVEEMKDAGLNNRCFYVISDRLDKKEFGGSVELCLLNNFIADSNNVPEEERMKIRAKLFKDWMYSHPFYKEPNPKEWIDHQKSALFGIGQAGSDELKETYHEGWLFPDMPGKEKI